VFCLVFHPYDWSTPQMIVDLIDHATAKHGKKVKFLNFRECMERLNKNVLVGHPIRDVNTGEPGIGEIWKWNTGTHVSVLIYKDTEQSGEFRAWDTDSGGRPSWRRFNVPPSVPVTSRKKIKLGPANATVFFRKKTEDEHSILVQSDKIKIPKIMPFDLPSGAVLGDAESDYGLRFIDLDGDGFDDAVFSNEKEYGIYLFSDMEHGWSRKVMAGKQGEPGALPPIAINGKNNGFFVPGRYLLWQNENTHLPPDHIHKRPFNQMLPT